MQGDELLGCGHHGREPALHIRGAAAIEHALADLRHEGIAVPLIEWAGRYHIGMPREAKQRSPVTAACPEVGDIPEWQRLDHETDPLEVLREERLAAFIGGSHGATGNEIPSQFNGLRHWLAVIRPQLQRGKRGAPSRLCKVGQQHCAGPQGCGRCRSSPGQRLCCHESVTLLSFNSRQRSGG